MQMLTRSIWLLSWIEFFQTAAFVCITLVLASGTRVDGLGILAIIDFYVEETDATGWGTNKAFFEAHYLSICSAPPLECRRTPIGYQISKGYILESYRQRTEMPLSFYAYGIDTNTPIILLFISLAVIAVSIPVLLNCIISLYRTSHFSQRTLYCLRTLFFATLISCILLSVSSARISLGTTAMANGFNRHQPVIDNDEIAIMALPGYGFIGVQSTSAILMLLASFFAIRAAFVVGATMRTPGVLLISERASEKEDRVTPS